ncbi:MAG: TetR/AcrR family transcriptional regulator [Desulfovibrio sp.]
MHHETNSTFRKLDTQKQERIFNTSLDEFAKCGFSGASMNTIVKRVGIAKGSLFKYFGNKEGLFAYIFESCIELFKGPLKEIRQSTAGDDFFLRMEKTLHAGVEFIEAHPKAYAIYLKMLYQADMPFRERFLQEVHYHSSRYLRPIIQEGIDAGELQKDMDLDMAVFFIHGIIDRFFQSLTVPAIDGSAGLYKADASTRQERITQIITFLKNGLGN